MPKDLAISPRTAWHFTKLMTRRTPSTKPRTRYDSEIGCMWHILAESFCRWPMRKFRCKCDIVATCGSWRDGCTLLYTATTLECELDVSLKDSDHQKESLTHIFRLIWMVCLPVYHLRILLPLSTVSNRFIAMYHCHKKHALLVIFALFDGILWFRWHSLLACDSRR